MDGRLLDIIALGVIVSICLVPFFAYVRLGPCCEPVALAVHSPTNAIPHRVGAPNGWWLSAQ